MLKVQRRLSSAVEVVKFSTQNVNEVDTMSYARIFFVSSVLDIGFRIATRWQNVDIRAMDL